MTKSLIVITIFLSIATSHAQVGINTTSPSDGSILDIESGGTKGMLVPRVDISNLNTIDPIIVTTTAEESLLVYNTNTTTGKGFYFWSGSEWIALGVDNDWITSGDDIYNNNSGNVGIGTSSPARKLSVEQTGDGNPFVFAGSPNMLLFESTLNDSSIGHLFRCKTATGEDREIVLGINPDVNAFAITNGAGFDIFTYNFATSDSFVNRFGGNFAVGNVFPQEKLHVIGNIRATGNLQSGTTTYPDYVFEAYKNGSSILNKNYRFKSLNEISIFIKENNHLPGIKSIDELQKNEAGVYNVDITETMMKLLEKIEELYLHTIEQEKKINALQELIKKR